MSIVEDYYRRSYLLYKLFWYSKESLGLNYGFWKKNTNNRHEAIKNLFLDVVNKAKITNKMRILDAGCGVGGGAIYIAKNTGAKVNAITITYNQVIEAKKNAKQSGVENLIHFELMDYTKTTFPNNYFDVVFGIESICYATPKTSFLSEAYRILKPGGILYIADGYSTKVPQNIDEKEVIEKFCDGWKLSEMKLVTSMTSDIESVGFTNIVIEDMTKSVQKSFIHMQKLVLLARPFTWLSKLSKNLVIQNIKDNSQALEMGMLGVHKGLFGHYTHIAKK